MCGIVGLFLKNPSLQSSLGEHFGAMLDTMSSRGPDSAGFAVYGNGAADGSTRYTLYHPDPDFDWSKVAETLRAPGSDAPIWKRVSTHAIFEVPGNEGRVRVLLKTHYPDVRVMSVGQSIQIMKETGSPHDVIERFEVGSMSGTHAIGHTRMATESAVTTAGSHPFSTGPDLCLVHNGSLSNHNNLRRNLRRDGIEFETENDSEVAAGYITSRLKQGDSLKAALERALDDLDGFFTFAVGTRDGFAVLRDHIACKPAVMAETDDYVAMASEYRSLVSLPGISEARLWEPEPATVYSWKLSDAQ